MSHKDVMEVMFSHLSSPAASVHVFVKNVIVAHTPVRGFPALPSSADMNLLDLPTLPASGRLPSIAQSATLTALPWAGSVRHLPSTVSPRRKSHFSRTWHSTSPSPRASAYAEAETAESSSSSSVHSLADYDRTAATLYDLLGISRTGTQAEIKGAYRQLARRYHPDTNRPGSTPGGLTVEECTRRFIEVQEAYEILSDPQRRAMYDFEMMHGRGHAWRNRLRQQQAPATWRQGRRASANADPIWQNPEEELAVKASWKAQWQNQMDGLRNRGSANPKPGSWAARMRQQHQERQHQRHEQGETSDA